MNLSRKERYMATRVVNVRNHRGPCIYVGREIRRTRREGHPLGSPFPLRKGASDRKREECVARYREWLAALPGRDELLLELARQVKETGLPLGCWCVPKLCHGVVLAEEVDRILAAGGG